MKRFIAAALVFCLLCGFGSAFAAMEAGDARAVMGANITDEQKSSVYATFGVKRGSVPELTVTNAEEREYLDGLIPSSEIGTNAISCVYIEITAPGSGLEVTTTENISYCTKETYLNALVTAGIDDAKVIVTAPISGISGTAALTGIYKAYEDISGEELDEVAKLIGTQELVITSELAEEIGSYDATMIVNELKKILAETKNMTDAELEEQIRSIARDFGVNVTDGQIGQLVGLCRSLEKLDTTALKEKVESVQNTIKKLAGAQETANKFVESVKSFFKSIGNFFSGLFGKKS